MHGTITALAETAARGLEGVQERGQKLADEARPKVEALGQKILEVDKPGAPHLGVSHLTVLVKGAKAHARKVLESLDWKRLKALMVK